MKIALFVAILAFISVPTAVASLMTGAFIYPCMCCLDVRMPDISPLGAAIGLTLLFGFFALMAWANGREEQRRQAEAQKKHEETVARWGWWVGRELTVDGQRGVVVRQEEDTLYINTLNTQGGLTQFVRKTLDFQQNP